MIQRFTGEFFLHPIPFEMSMDYCSHRCVYCFTSVRPNKPQFNLKGFITQMENFQKGKDSWMFRKLREGYPVALSNNSDPFSKNNEAYTETVLEYFKANNIRVFFQTKGGRRAEELIKAYGIKSCVYVTMTTDNEEISKRIEPNAPTPEERIALIKSLKAMGNEVIVGINPLNPHWMNEEHTFALMEKLHQIGVYSFMFQPLFIRKKRVELYKQRDFAGVDLEGKDEYKNLNEVIRTLVEIEEQKKYKFQTLYHPYRTDAFDIVKSVYSQKTLPIVYDFLNQIWDKPKGKREFDLKEFRDWFIESYNSFFEEGQACNLLSYLFVQSKNEYKKHCTESANSLSKMAEWYFNFTFKRFGYLEYIPEKKVYRIRGILKLKEQ